jgi:hypothetical protein
MLINNYFTNSFLIIVLFNILNFGTHENNCTPEFFSCNYDFYFCKIKINGGSFYCYNIHLHHWILGASGLLMLSFFKNSAFKSILEGILFATFIDGLLFSDRFIL